MSLEDVVGRIMDKAETADRRALFAALQAALLGAFRLSLEGSRVAFLNEMLRVEKALDLGAPYGSPEQLASLEGDHSDGSPSQSEGGSADA